MSSDEIPSAADRPPAETDSASQSGLSPLSARQLECLTWISEGKSSTDVGAILRISGRTVDAHVEATCARLGVRTRMQAVTIALEQGWIRPRIRD